jgi:molecular chaperone DnaK
MVREAEEHSADDARRRAEVDLRNRADNLAYAAEKVVREQGDQLASELKMEIDNGAQAVRKALDQNDMDALRSATEALERAMERAETERAAPVGAAAGGERSGGAGEAGSDDGTVEGEYREV